MRCRFFAALVLLGACGGSGTPASPTVAETATFTGTTRSTSATSCTGDSHTFTAADGPIFVTLVSTSTGEDLTAQVCPPNSTDCTLTRQRINIGQTLEGARKGGASQVLSLLPLNCGTSAPPSPDSIAYTARVLYSR